MRPLKPLLTFLFCILTISLFSQRNHIIWDGGWETASDITKWPNPQYCCATSLTISNLFAREGTHSLQVDLKKTDASVAGSKRAEVGLNPESAVIIGRRYAFSVYYPAGYVTDPNPELFWQLHSQNTADLPPPFAVWLTNGRFHFYNYSYSGPINKIAQPLLTPEIDQDLGPATTGTWHDFIIHIKFDSTSKGLLEVWVDGVQQINHAGPNIYTGDNQPLYLKEGLYKWPWNGTNDSPESERTFYLDASREGDENSTNADVAPGDFTNTNPIANAGGTQMITLPTNQVTLDGSASSDPGGYIAKYKWTKVSGPAAGTLINSDSAIAIATALTTAGQYVYLLTVTDNLGAQATSQTTVQVNPSGNAPPVANAGINQLLPTTATSTTLIGTASTDPDGSIAGYRWTLQTGNTSAVIVNYEGSSTSVTGLKEGSYTFKLEVTDNKGATAIDTVNITVDSKKKDTTQTFPTQSLDTAYIAPNPAKTSITVLVNSKTNGTVQISITNMYGQVVKSVSDKKTSYSYSKAIQLTGVFFRNGIYSVKISIGNTYRKTLKLIITK